jgi:hypothetical protein
MGVLSALPLISAGNLCCCLWVISGGLVAAYVFQQNHPLPMTAGDGALVGLLAGLCGAFVQVALSIPISLVVGPMERVFLQRVLDMAGTMPPEMRDAVERYGREGQAAGAWLLARSVFALMIWLCVGAAFSTLGGLIGSALFRRQSPPGTIDVSPSTPS